MDNICNFCQKGFNSFFSKDKKREYYKCNHCKIITVPPEYYLTPNEEKKRYDKHSNSINDKEYIDFLSRVVKPVIANVSSFSSGLDFGCGPGPVLKSIFRDYNLSIQEYDLYYRNDSSLLKKKWDFIITTEVIEHLKDPFSTVSLLWSILKDGGILVIMTNLYNTEIDFNSWYYKGDPTHISFFCKDTMLWLSDKISAEIDFIDKDIIILKKKQYIIPKTEEKT